MRGDSTCTGAAVRRSMRVVSLSPRVSTEVAPDSSAWRAFLAASFSARRAAPIATYSWASSGVTKESALGRRAL